MFLNAAAYYFLCVRVYFSESFAKKAERFETTNAYVSIPAFVFEFYAGFVLAVLPYRFINGYLKESYFNFTRLSPPGWLLMLLKQAVIEALIVSLVLMFIKLIVSKFSENWHYILPLCVPAAGLAFSMAAQFLILPFFYVSSPMPESALKKKLAAIAGAHGVTASEIYVINESAYSNHTNAFFTGFGPFKNIYLCDTLFQSHAGGEIESIYAHELGHYIYNHEFYGILTASAAICAFIFVIKLFIRRRKIPPQVLTANFNRSAALMIILFYHVAGFFAMPVENYISRQFERACDRFAIESVIKYNQSVLKNYKPGEAAENAKNLFINLARKNLSNLAPDRFNYFFFATHPAVAERIKNCEKYL
ncbi:MAG: heat shock protein HtpX [bacterium ADurb.Bin243]|nr:MAG: heat shock protein HtpX [bacterium ADurb.Bin243]